jgi:hypothetical protein
LSGELANAVVEKLEFLLRKWDDLSGEVMLGGVLSRALLAFVGARSR